MTLRLISVVLFAGMSAAVKYLGRNFPTGETIFARGVISLIVLALIAAARPGRRRTAESQLQRARVG